MIDEDFAEDKSGTLSFNITGGMRFGERDKIYNGGVSATYSYMSDLGHLKDGYNNPYYMDATLDFSSFYLTYDNYIRLSGDAERRIDLVASLGFGMGWINESISIGTYQETYEDDGMLLVMKLGITGETSTEGLGWYAGWNFISPNAEDDADLQGSIGFDLGVKYTF